MPMRELCRCGYLDLQNYNMDTYTHLRDLGAIFSGVTFTMSPEVAGRLRWLCLAQGRQASIQLIK